MSSPTLIAGVVLAVAAAAVAWQVHDRSSHDDAVAEYLIEGSRLEKEGAFAHAIQVYSQAMDEDSGLDLGAAERAELRYRLANVMIQGNDLQGALGEIQDLIDDDVAKQRIDVTPLLMELGDRAIAADNKPLAKLAYRLGMSVSVTASRATDFAEKQEQFIRDPGQ